MQHLWINVAVSLLKNISISIITFDIYLGLLIFLKYLSFQKIFIGFEKSDIFICLLFLTVGVKAVRIYLVKISLSLS